MNLIYLRNDVINNPFICDCNSVQQYELFHDWMDMCSLINNKYTSRRIALPMCVMLLNVTYTDVLSCGYYDGSWWLMLLCWWKRSVTMKLPLKFFITNFLEAPALPEFTAEVLDIPLVLFSGKAEKLALLSCRVSSAILGLALWLNAVWYKCMGQVSC